MFDGSATCDKRQDCPQAGGGGESGGRANEGNPAPRVNVDGSRVIVCNGREIVVEAETDEEKKRREEGLKLLHRVDSKKHVRSQSTHALLYRNRG